MRIALVSPYSWSYPGGVTRHIEALAEQFMAGGHDVRVLAPYDPPDRLSARMHRGARPEARELPDWVIPLGRTIGVKSNGAVSNLPHTPYAITTLRRELRAGRFDVIHAHEPVAPVVGYDVLDTTIAPLVGTFHCYSENVDLQHDRQRASAPSASSSACTCASPSPRPPRGPAGASTAAATGSSPTGSTCPPSCPCSRRGRRARRCAWPSSARPSSARGFPCCCAPSRRCATTSRSSSSSWAPIATRSSRCMLDGTQGVDRAGQGLRRREGRRPWPRPTCSSRPRWAARASAWCSPRPSPPARRSSRPTSPAIATWCATGSTACSSRAATPPPWPRPCATSPWRPTQRAAMAVEARAHAPRYAWPTVAGEVLEAYTDAIAMPRAATARERAGVFLGAIPADLGPRRPAERRLPSLEASKREGRDRRRAAARKAGIGLAGLAAAFLALLALQRIGLDQIGDSLLRATPTWVLLGLGLMCGSMVVRGVAWHAILTAALPEARLRRSDALQGTFIGVLMSATLPGATRRALARADRGPPHGPPARPPAHRRGLDRLADAAQRRRAGRPGDRHVLDGRPLQPAPARPGRLRAGADGRARRRPRRCPRCCAAACPRARAASRRPWPRSAPRSPRCAPA